MRDAVFHVVNACLHCAFGIRDEIDDPANCGQNPDNREDEDDKEEPRCCFSQSDECVFHSLLA